MTQKIKRVFSKVADVPILVFCLFAIAVFLFILYHSIFGFIDLIRSAVNLRGQMLFTGILIAVVYGITSYVANFVNTFASTWRHLFNKQKEVN